MSSFSYNKNIVILKKNRIAKFYEKFNFLKKHSTDNFLHKLKSLDTSFNNVLEIGVHNGQFTEKFLDLYDPNTYVATDISMEMLRLNNNKILKINSDEELLLFKKEIFDGIFSCLYLSNVNDINLLLKKFKEFLSPNGLIIFSLYGSQTLKELKDTFIKSEIEFFGGISPVFNNFFDIRNLSDLLLKIGFKNPVVETDIVKVKYQSVIELMLDLRGIGETNSLEGRRKKFLTKGFLDFLNKNYKKNFLNEDNINVDATFEIITASCWK